MKKARLALGTAGLYADSQCAPGIGMPRLPLARKLIFPGRGSLNDKAREQDLIV
jgi:hypothetical protein